MTRHVHTTGVVMPLTESQAHALALRFQHWDRDHNGFIEWSDLEAAVARLAEAFGRDSGAPERGALVSSCRKFWRVLLRHADAAALFELLDTDGDGHLSHGEFVRAASNRFVDEKSVSHAPPASR